MSLALRLGRTLAELRQSMTASELMMWIEYDRHSPVGDVRGDIQAAQITSAVYGAQGAKVALNDVLLQWSGNAETEEKDPFIGLEEALRAASN
ncbi:MAG: DUF4035 domain-containing protein [Enterobacteriaceae bacterium]|nr:DUF4035 domain-containing protein [Enterobacteriaceae bacterium]